MEKYTRKDIILFTDDPRLKNAIGKQVYGADCPTHLLSLANYGNSDIWCEPLAIINKYADSRPFVTKVEGNEYKHYDVIILKKDEYKGEINA